MHELVGNQKLVVQSLDHVSQQCAARAPEVVQGIQAAMPEADATTVEACRNALADRLAKAHANAKAEPSHDDCHYVSRFDFVGLFQSVLGKVFADVPDMQGYGDKNPAWATTLLEEFMYDVGALWNRVQVDVQGKHESLLHAVVKELSQLTLAKAVFPAGTPTPLPLPDGSLVLLADWGGDNDTARTIAGVVTKHNPQMGIHLGDIYYGGTKLECETFVRLWPFHTDPADPATPLRQGTSFALNGNHEMYSGGEHYFKTVLSACGQPQSFFCLENDHWRLIGLDTAYNGGRLKPNGPDDPITDQWNWLIALLKNDAKRANIFLTHHQPVSAHAAEFGDSAMLRSDIHALLATDGIGEDAIFAWFFGHEHRCAIYTDKKLPYKARLIGNGCIPHEVQAEKDADPGCTEVDFFNKRETMPGSHTAVSSFAKLTFSGVELRVEYLDEDNFAWGIEIWRADEGRFGGVPFQETDGYDDRAVATPGN